MKGCWLTSFNSCLTKLTEEKKKKTSKVKGEKQSPGPYLCSRRCCDHVGAVATRSNGLWDSNFSFFGQNESSTVFFDVCRKVPYVPRVGVCVCDMQRLKEKREREKEKMELGIEAS
ncbi:hypothetical protein Taro_021473 [Colocasia esculenta]|uniref:Uncharacterized protein n=1 Tax=Colocasia esculenta TaxID=4460 RepID=A0A843UZ44_COLES|nr:hypothetical protein [Colocasia esculenta]